jgi:hypothetical protein
MAENTSLEISESFKLEVVQGAFEETRFNELLKPLDAKQLRQVQEYMWDFVLIESQGTSAPFTRVDILSRMEPTAKHQEKQHCIEPLGFCTMTMCLRINPSCAAIRIRGIIEVLRGMTLDIIKHKPEILTRKIETSEKPQELFPTPIPDITPITTAEPNPALVSTKPVESSPNAPSSAQVTPATKPVATRQPLSAYATAVMKKERNLRDLLYSIIELENIDNVMLLDGNGNSLVSLTAKGLLLDKAIELTEAEIQNIQEQGKFAHFNQLVTVIKEYEQGIFALKGLGNDLFLTVSTETISPSQTHVLINKLARQLHIALDQLSK